MSNPTPTPELMSNPVSAPEQMSNLTSAPELMSNPASAPEQMSNPNSQKADPEGQKILFLHKLLGDWCLSEMLHK